ncbi:hypothetical protein CC79DRAFT_1129042 [Sarocladium strictum]
MSFVLVQGLILMATVIALDRNCDQIRPAIARHRAVRPALGTIISRSRLKPTTLRAHSPPSSNHIEPVRLTGARQFTSLQEI